MFSSQISPASSNFQRVQTQSGTPKSPNKLPEEPFCSSFSSANGDLALGRSSSIKEGDFAWSPTRLLESVLVVFNIMSSQTDMFDFDTGVTEINNSPKTMNDLVDSMFVVLREEKQRKKLSVDNTSTGVTPNAGVDDIISYFEGLLDCMEEVEEKIKNSDGCINQIFTETPSVFSRHKLDELFAALSQHPLYDASELEELTNINARQRIHESASRLFSCISKGMIDGFIQQGRKAEPGQAQHNEMARIHYFLDGIQMEEVVNNTGSSTHGILAEDLRHLFLRRGELGDTVKFYRDNMAVNAPWAEDPDLWGRCIPSPDNVNDLSSAPWVAPAIAALTVPGLEQRRVPIPMAVESQPQKPIDPERIYELYKNDKNEYVFVNKGDGNKYALEGALVYVILEEEPDHIYCGLKNGEKNWDGSINKQRYHLEDYLDGHSALADEKPVLFAGEMLFEQGEVKFWTNGSGHYLPDAELRFINLTDSVKRLLPEEHFRDHDKLTKKDIADQERYLRLPQWWGDTANESESSQSDDDENVACVKQQQKKFGLKGGGPSRERVPEDICAPLANTLEKKPRDDGSDKGGAGAAALSGTRQSGSTSDSENDDDTKPDKPSGPGNAISSSNNTSTVSVGKSPDIVGVSSAQLQREYHIALNSGGEIVAVQIGRMLKFAISLAESPATLQATVVNLDLFEQASKLRNIHVSYFNGRFNGADAAHVPKQIMISLTQALNNCVRNGAISEAKAQAIFAQYSLGDLPIPSESENIFARPQKQIQMTTAIRLLIGTVDQQRAKIAVGNHDRAVRKFNEKERNARIKRGDAELHKYSVAITGLQVNARLARRDKEIQAWRELESKSKAESTAKNLNERAARQNITAGFIAAASMKGIDLPGRSNSIRKQGQSDSWRSEQNSLAEIKVGKLWARSDSTESTDSGYDSASAMGSSSRRASITSAIINQEISNMKSQISPGFSSETVSRLDRSFHESWPSAKSTVMAEQAFINVESQLDYSSKALHKEIQKAADEIK